MLRRAFLLLISLQAVMGFAEDNLVFKARREALMKKLQGSVAVLQGAPATRDYSAFRQDNNFYYLTGVEVPNALLLVDSARNASHLFLPPRDKSTEQWEGPDSSAAVEAAMDAVLERSRFAEELEKRKSALRVLYVPLSPYEVAATSGDRALLHDSTRREDTWDGRASREESFAANLRAKLGPLVRIENLSPILDEMRRVKDAQEIQRLREAGRIGALGLKEAIRSAKPGMYEYQVAAVAEFIFRWHGAFGPAFFPIAGSGPNSCILHYSRNDRKMEPGEVMVLDFGADYRYYVSDITRTFPVSGRFTEEQAKVYQAVLDAQKAALEKVRPGGTFRALNEAAREVLGKCDLEQYLPHSVSHYVGMAAHDVGKSEPFEEGVVLTVEPGVYIPEKNLGIRIEDTVLVTKDGYEILSKDVPKEISGIEALMLEKGIAEAVKQ